MDIFYRTYIIENDDFFKLFICLKCSECKVHIYNYHINLSKNIISNAQFSKT